MKHEITISELAKLMNVSVHQIRYFEEKGVLEPAYTDNNLYRIYGMDQESTNWHTFCCYANWVCLSKPLKNACFVL